jgi:ClpA/ClpB-like protein
VNEPDEPVYSAPLTPVVARAAEIAAELGDALVGTDHLLLAISERDEAAARVLAAMGLTLERGRAAVYVLRAKGNEFEHVRQRISRDRAPDYPALSTAARVQHPSELGGAAMHSLVSAVNAAQQLGHAAVRPEHLLLGILAKPTATAVGILRSCGVSPAELREQILVELAQLD